MRQMGRWVKCWSDKEVSKEFLVCMGDARMREKHWGVGVYELGQELAYVGQPVTCVTAVLPYVIHTSCHAVHPSRAVLKMKGVN